MNDRRWARWMAGAAVALLVVGCSTEEQQQGTDMGGVVADAGDDAAVPGDDMAPDLGPELVLPEGCNPAAFEVDCMLPFPSDVFLVEGPDGTRRVELSDEAAPKTVKGQVVDVYEASPPDGFSFHMPIMALFSQPVDPAGLLGEEAEPAGSTMATNTTLLIEASTGRLVPHFAEVDQEMGGPLGRHVTLRPWERLRGGERYVVAFQGLQTEDGQLLPAPAGFRHLRDGLVERVEGLARYEDEWADVFAVLEQAGVERSGLQLAWGFTVRSDEGVKSTMLQSQAIALQALEAGPPQVVIDKVERPEEGAIGLRIEGRLMMVPLVVEANQPGAPVSLDEMGNVVANGTTGAPFTVTVPRTHVEAMQAGGDAARAVQYGHGFFGKRDEVGYSATRKFLPGIGDIALFAVDWVGMSEPDVQWVLGAIGRDISNIGGFLERLHQAMVNQLFLSAAIEDVFHTLPEFQIDGRPLYEPGQVHYYGISQGHILGGALLALSPHFERAVIGSGGGPYSFMMSRARSFMQFLVPISFQFRERLDILKLVAMLQHPFDPADPITWAPNLVTDRLPNASPSLKVLAQIGKGDAVVPVLAGIIHANSADLPLLTPSPLELSFFETVTAPHDGSALVVAAFPDQTQPPVGPVFGEENDIHDAVRTTPALMDQIDQFLDTGTIVNTCDGACDPE